MSAIRSAKLGVAIVCSGAAAAAAQSPAAGDPPASGTLRLRPGPHLLLDDALIESSRGVTRRVNPPSRDLPGPVVTGPGDGNYQPYVSVVRDPATRRFRMWYGIPGEGLSSHLATLESEDGVRWIRPRRVLDDPPGTKIQFGACVFDEGPSFPDPIRRFKFAWYQGPLEKGGLMAAVSPDGLAWTPLSTKPLVRHNHDIVTLFRDPLRNRYAALLSTYITGPDWTGQRRCLLQSTSDDLARWSEPRLVLTPDGQDEGETQFYGLGGVLARGDLLVGTLRVLRDDLRADDPPDPPNAFGIGYTVLAWSRDGETWTRDRIPFFDRDPRSGTWDHAHAWIDGALLVNAEDAERDPQRTPRSQVDDTLYLYYGGYARGHKVERFTERQIGLVRIPRDRYAAREAGEVAGMLRTPPVVLEGSGLALNADARGGAVRIRILDDEGRPLTGFGYDDHEPITTDALDLPVRWTGDWAVAKGRPVRLEFSLRRARLFAFSVLP